jgi:hypothetical protein
LIYSKYCANETIALNDAIKPVLGYDYDEILTSVELSNSGDILEFGNGK